jgi:hypothetical protein
MTDTAPPPFPNRIAHPCFSIQISKYPLTSKNSPLYFDLSKAMFYQRHMMGRSWWPDPPWGDPTHSALQILNERFARGEIQINPSR